jgi:hypothetical protein
MKKLLTFALLSAFVTFSLQACAQEDKSKRPSPPANTTVTTNTGVTISIDYSQPALKGRTMGKDVEPMAGKVWRTGANEATVFTIDKDVTVEGKKLPAGKYGLFTLVDANGWTIIFNKTWKQWGAFTYKQADDVLRVTVTPVTTASSRERFTINADKSGKVSLLWGTTEADFNVQ